MKEYEKEKGGGEEKGERRMSKIIECTMERIERGRREGKREIERGRDGGIEREIGDEKEN